METLLHFLVHRELLSPNQYWPMRLLCTISLGPLLAVMYMVLFKWRAARRLGTPAKPRPTMWINSEGKLLKREPHRRVPIFNIPTLVSPPSPKPHPRGWR